jgi:heme/copper-type cytochrome/quinol oxidase subunit 3
MNNSVIKNYQQSPFHLVDPSPYPILCAFSCFGLMTGMALFMHNFSNGGLLVLFSLSTLLFIMGLWFRDIVREATFEGNHTVSVQLSLRYGMLLFIVSEIMFFLAFFWAFFHSSLAPTVAIGTVFPPKGIETFSPWEIPFLNTIVLLSSGATTTYAHHSIVAGARKDAILALIFTVALAAFFTCLQAYEYMHASFTISDSIYGTVFYMCTGFHGFHVFVGTVFLGVCLLRLINSHFTRQHHFGFEAAAWYWHFVDVVWLFLFVSIYWWGGNI